MGIFGRVLLLASAVFLAITLKRVHDLSVALPVPKVDLTEYWGPGDCKDYTEDRQLKPFKLAYGEKTIEELKRKLSDVPKLAEPLEDTFQYGFNSKRLQQVLKYWREDYLPKWEDQQKFLNQYPQFKTQIQGLDIHFLRIKPEGVRNPKRILPLLLLHGWPGSVREFYEIIPMLTTRSAEKEFVFEVIVPSLPGFGFSQGAAKPGLSPSKIAVIMRNLMARLGHKKYYVYGGDWGAIVGSAMATLFQSEVLGLHSTMCLNNSPTGYLKHFIGSLCPKHFVDEEHIPYYYPLGDRFKTLLVETGYLHIQATKPDTVGAALTGNPVGLAAYILEKFSTYTNLEHRYLPDGGLERNISMDTLLDNLMTYYLSDSMTTAMRIYYEAFSFQEMALELDRIPTTVPTACAKIRQELYQQIDWALRGHFQNLIQSNYINSGHFVSMEVPNLLYNDIVQFVSRLYRREDQ